MNAVLFYALAGAGLFTLALYALIMHQHLLRKILAINIMGSGVFLILVALAEQTPIVHAMVITGIVVAVSATALALALMLRVVAETGQAKLPEKGAE